jgi:RimJ/RimL family protein N-acetyltransferase
MPPVKPASSLHGRVVTLGPLDPGDSPTFARWVNDPALRPFLNRPWRISEEEERRRVETLIHAEDALGFAVRLREDRSLIGRASIWNIHKVNRCGLFTIFIGEPARWSRGHGKEATALTAVYAMDVLKLNRLELEVFAYNERALRCYESLGFRREGVRREARFHEGRYHDAIQMAILAREWSGGLKERFRGYLDPSGVEASGDPGSSG